MKVNLYDDYYAYNTMLYIFLLNQRLRLLRAKTVYHIELWKN